MNDARDTVNMVSTLHAAGRPTDITVMRFPSHDGARYSLQFTDAKTWNGSLSIHLDVDQIQALVECILPHLPAASAVVEAEEKGDAPW